MQRKTEEARRDGREAQRGDEETFRVEDRRHWTQPGDDAEQPSPAEQGGDGAGEGGGGPRKPSLIEEYRRRTEAAESKLHEYIEAYKRHQAEQDEFRARLAQDVDRRVELKFGEMVAELLHTVDDLDRALSHVDGVPEAEPLARGVAMARSQFLSVLETHGVTKIEPVDVPFDPNEAEAMRVDAVDDPTRNNLVTETLQPGYRLGERVIRPARVAVGRHDS